jgi:hypothetical protein
MNDTYAIRYVLMIPVAACALILSFGPLASVLLALANFEYWMWYGYLYVATAVLALICTGMVYVIRDVGR